MCILIGKCTPSVLARLQDESSGILIDIGINDYNASIFQNHGKYNIIFDFKRHLYHVYPFVDYWKCYEFACFIVKLYALPGLFKETDSYYKKWHYLAAPFADFILKDLSISPFFNSN